MDELGLQDAVVAGGGEQDPASSLARPDYDAGRQTGLSGSRRPQESGIVLSGDETTKVLK